MWLYFWVSCCGNCYVRYTQSQVHQLFVVKLLETGRDWGPKNQNKDNKKAEGCLSDHPWVWCELEISDVD